MNKITVQKALDLNDVIIVDTRTSSEFEIDHIPSAINIPIFDNVERREIGTLYKADQDKAFELGMEYYSKKLPDLTNEFKKLDKTKTIVLYCWRGGIRSKAITQLVDLLGYDAYQLEGGYKLYRAFIRDSLNTLNKKFIVLWGNTGVAKTKLLHKISSSLDLEGLAQHRGSVFGGLGFKRRSQKYFETLLYFELKKLPEIIFVEGESRKIGNLVVPEIIYTQIQKGVNIKIESSINCRVENIVDEYFISDYLDEIKIIIPKLKEKKGTKFVDELLSLMESNDYSKVAEILLIEYYDPLYKHTLQAKKFTHTVCSDDKDKCVKDLLNLVQDIS